MYHVGIVVPDVNEARARFTALLRVEWGPIIQAEQVEMRLDDGSDVVFPSRICFTTAPPHIELIQELPGSTWVCNEHSNLHHIGFFSHALKADSAGLTRAQCPLELSGRQGGDPPSGFVYHRDPLGVRIEFVDATQRSMMEELFFKPQEVEELVFKPEAQA
jgi:catechol 2,3-dioxygenase-like lactoylglutathione lyase family enzyme